jgi:hypothetical protein
VIRILLIDPETLLDATGTPLPAPLAALDALRRLETVQGGPLLLVPASCGRSSVESAQKVASPEVASRLATAAAIAFPSNGGPGERRALESALQQIVKGAKLAECAAVLRDEDWVLAARSLGIPSVAPGVDKIEWREVPLLLARLIDPSNLGNLGAALAPRLPPDVERASVVAAQPEQLVVRAQRWWPLPTPRPDLPEGLNVLFPVDMTVAFERSGRVGSVVAADPSPAQVAEADALVEQLFAAGQVALEPGRREPGATHVVEQSAGGRRRLRALRPRDP